MVQFIAILFGIAFIFAGVAGFLPVFTMNGLLFGWFQVGLIHNMIHLITGVIAIICSTNYRITKLFFTVFGLIYTIIAIVGFWRNGDLILIHVNTADNIFHIVVGVIALYLGLSRSRTRAY